MKLIIYIAIFMTCTSVNAQGWRDTLEMAREAYDNDEFSKALDYYENAQKSAPKDVNLSDEMAQSAYKAREFEKAEKIYQQNSTSKKSSVKKAENQHNIGNARMKRKDYEGAIEAYKESLRQNPNDDQTRYNLSEAIRQLKNQQKKENNNGNGGNNNDNNQNNNNQDNNQNGDDNQNGDQQQNNGGDQNQNNNQNQSQGNSGEQESEGHLQNKMVDRMLDKLMKDEAETKRKMYGTKGKNSTPRSGKDW